MGTAKHVAVCRDCGREHRTQRKPGTALFPLVCRECNVEQARLQLARILNRKKLETKGKKETRKCS